VSSPVDPYQIVLEVGATVTSSLHLEETLATIARQVGEALDVQYCDIHEYDAAGDTMTCAAEWTPLPDPEEESYVGTVVPVEERDGLRALLEGGALLEEYADDAALSQGERELMLRWHELASLEAPLRIGDEVIGVICVAERARPGRRFTADERRLLELLAAPAAIAIRNARAYRARAERTRGLAAVLEASRAITASTDLDEVLHRVSEAAVEVVNASQSAIYEYRAETDSIVYRSLYERFAPPDVQPDDDLGTAYVLDDYPGDRAILLGGDVVVEHASDRDLAVDRRASMLAWGEKTVLNVPLVFRGAPVGVLRLYDMVDERSFSVEEIELMRSLGELASAALHNARMFDAQKEQRARLVGLCDTSRALGSTFDASAVVEAARAGALRLFGAGAEVEVWLALADGGFAPADVVLAEAARTEEDGPGAGAPGAGALPPLAAEALATLRPAERVEDAGSSLVVPLTARGRAEGFICVAAAARLSFLTGEVEALQVLANQTAVALANAGLYGQVQEQAIRDGLTGLYNHRHFQERLHQECVRALRYGLPLSLLMIDVDDFKRFNDEHGHPLGDEVLREVGAILIGSTRQGVDIPARYGGEEFAVILPHTTASGAECLGQRLCEELAELDADVPPRGTGAAVVADRLRGAVADHAFAGRGGRRYARLTVSVGIAALDQGGPHAADLVSNADKALYVAKRAGKNRIEVYASASKLERD
jgi:diguanylate cyclase (GGDEF)-like protein